MQLIKMVIKTTKTNWTCSRLHKTALQICQCLINFQVGLALFYYLAESACASQKKEYKYLKICPESIKEEGEQPLVSDDAVQKTETGNGVLGLGGEQTILIQTNESQDGKKSIFRYLL